MKLSKLSVWDVAYAVDMAIACLITYWAMVFLLPNLVGWPSSSVGVLWAVISTVFVYKDTRAHSLSAGISRLITTFASFALCLIYLWLLPATTSGMAALIAIGVLLMILIGRRDETGLTAITIAVIMIIAASNPQDAWQQPLLRLVDTVVGIAVGVACKWAGSFVFYRIIGEEVRRSRACLVMSLRSRPVENLAARVSPPIIFGRTHQRACKILSIRKKTTFSTVSVKSGRDGYSL